MKKVLGNRVLVEQIMTKKKSSLVLTPDQKTDPDNFEIERKVIMLGDEVEEGKIAIGDIPVFGKYGEADSIKIISKDDNKMISHLVMHVENIVGLEELDIK